MILAGKWSLWAEARCKKSCLRYHQSTARWPYPWCTWSSQNNQFRCRETWIQLQKRVRALWSNFHPIQSIPEMFPHLFLFLRLHNALYSLHCTCFGNLGKLLQPCWASTTALKIKLRYRGVNSNSPDSSWHEVWHQSACKSSRLTLKSTLWLVKELEGY